MPEQVQSDLSNQLPELRGVRWTHPAKYHITLKFYGALTPTKIDHALTELDTVRKHFPISCQAKVLDGFRNRRSARVVIVRVRSECGILESLGDRKPLVPHITVGYSRTTPVSVPEIEIRSNFRLDEPQLVKSKNGVYQPVGDNCSRQK